MINITTVEFVGDPKEALKEVFSGMNQQMRDWTMKAARGECAWICSSCCASDQRGMPDECFGGVQWCTDIITRDKQHAKL